MNMRRSKARQKFHEIVPVNHSSSSVNVRNEWIDEVCTGFVQPSKRNREYYRVVLETLWPECHGLPGPYVSETDIRNAIDQYRRSTNPSVAPYVDVFRRVRELQGEEGVVGIARRGRIFQLVNLELGPKRVPRTHLNDEVWMRVKQRYGNACANCGRKEPDVVFDDDHKVPRERGGSDDESNRQPLCHECNNRKSAACRGCRQECQTCPWAFPEMYGDVRLSTEQIRSLREVSARSGEPVMTLLDLAIKRASEETA